jgi:hypothetical protein
MNQAHTLTYKADTWSRNHGRALGETDPTFRYEVAGERGHRVGYITNVCASGRLLCWQICRVSRRGNVGKSIGEYSTPEKALAALQADL